MSESNENVWGCLDGDKFNNRTLITKVENNITLKKDQELYDMAIDGMIVEIILDDIHQRLKDMYSDTK